MTIPALDRLIHKWDPAFASGQFVQDTVSGAHALKGDVEIDYPHQFFARRVETFEDRARPPSNSTRRVMRSFDENSSGWTDLYPEASYAYRHGLNGWSGWGYGGILDVWNSLTATEGTKMHTLTSPIAAAGDEWIYFDLWYSHEFLFPHTDGVNTIGRLRIDGSDALIINVYPKENIYSVNGDQELGVNVLQPDYTPYTMNLLSSDVDAQPQFNRWTWNRIQLVSKRGAAGELHVWLNDEKIAEHTGVDLSGAAWDEVELSFQWGSTPGPLVYDDFLVFPAVTYDEVSYGLLDIRTMVDAPEWFTQPLNGNEPTHYTKLILDPGSNGKTVVNATNLWDNGYMGTFIGDRVDNLSNGSPSGHTGWGFGVNSQASPLKFIYDPHWLMGTSHYEGIVVEGIATQIGESLGEWWDNRQWGWGNRWQGMQNQCRYPFQHREDLYVCAYFSLGAGYELPQYSATNLSFVQWIACVCNHNDFAYTPNTDERGIGIDQIGTYGDPDGVPRLYFECGGAGSTSTRVEIERERIYKVELLLTDTLDPTFATASWWVDGSLIDSGLLVSAFGQGVTGVRWMHKYSWDEVGGHIATVTKDQNARLYYMYASTPDTSLQDYREPTVLAAPARIKYNELDAGDGSKLDYGHEHLKVPVGDEYFYVGEERDEWTIAFVFRHTNSYEFGATSQFLLDSWEGLFGGFLPSIVLGGINRTAKGAGKSSQNVPTANSTKIQLNYLGTTYISVADRPLDTDWHTLVVSFSQYGTMHVRVWLDGVKTYDAYPWTNDGRWFAQKFTGDEQKQYMTLFTSCDTGEWWRNQEDGSDDHNIATDTCGTHLWGCFHGEAGPVFFWDRQLMYNEVLQLHADLAGTYTPIPAGPPPTTNTLTAPTNVTVVPDQGICKATWDDVVDPSGFEVRFEVEISTNSGGSWAPLRGLDDLEPGGIPRLFFSARPYAAGAGYRIRVRGFNGVNFSDWGESGDFTIGEWAAFLIQTPTRDGGWYDGATEYPGSRLARDAICYSPSNTIPKGDPGYPGDSSTIGDFYYYEAPVGKAIAGVHFYDFKIERNIDWLNLWGYNPTDGWFNYMDVRRTLEEGYSPKEFLNNGYWGQHWMDIQYWVEQGWVSEATTAVAFSLNPYEHNTWYQNRGGLGAAVDAFELTDGTIDNPEPPEEPEEPPAVGSPCGAYQECWIGRPNLKDYETYFVPGDTHLFARTLYGLAVGVTVVSATLRILEYEDGPAIVNSAATALDLGDGSADLTYQLTTANTTSIGAEDARPYQLIVTLSDGSVITVNAGIIKGSAPAVTPAP